MDKVRELVVTVSAPGGEIVKIAELKSSPARRDLTEHEFAELAANGEEESLVAALEEAYAAGAEDVGAENAAGLRILWDAAARQRLRAQETKARLRVSSCSPPANAAVAAVAIALHEAA